MKLKVLGCYGGQLPGFRTSSFLINDHILLDAGSVTSVLKLEEQMKIDYILITHSHIDHIKDILFLADNVCGKNSNTIKVISTAKNLSMLKKHLLNNDIWPDFSVLPSKHTPVLEFIPIKEGQRVGLRDIIIEPVRVSHTVETMGYIIMDKHSTIIFSSDTGPTNKLWRKANSLKNLKAIFIETSYPNVMKDMANISRHFTPAMLSKEIKKLKHRNVKFLVYHLKPLYCRQIIRELKKINNKNIHILKQGATLKF